MNKAGYVRPDRRDAGAEHPLWKAGPPVLGQTGEAIEAKYGLLGLVCNEVDDCALEDTKLSDYTGPRNF
jgi:hypothetical protein